MSDSKGEKKKGKQKNGKKGGKKGKQTTASVPPSIVLLTKILGWTTAGLLAILILALIFRDLLLGFFLEKTATWFLGADVAIEEVNTSLLRGTIVLKGLRIANPPGFDASTAFECEQLLADLDLPSFFTRKKIIRKLYILGVNTTAEYNDNGELNAAKFNETIQTHLPQDSDPDFPTKSVAKGVKDTVPSILIRDFRFSARAFLRADRIDLILEIPLNPIQERDLLLQDSGKSLSRTLFDYTQELDRFCDSFLNAKGFILDAGKGLIKEAGNTGEHSRNFMEKAAQSVWDSVTGIFQQEKSDPRR